MPAETKADGPGWPVGFADMSEIDEYLDMAIVLIKRGKIEKARALLRDLIFRYPDNPKVQDEVVNLLSFARQAEEKLGEESED